MGALVVSADLTILFWNRCLEEWTGFPKGQMVGAALLDCFPNLAAPRYLNRIRGIFDGSPPTVFSSQLHPHLIPAPLPGGKFRTQYTVVTGLPAEGCHRFHALFSIQDVTSLSEAIDNYHITHRGLLAEMAERRRAEDKLKKTAEELNKLNLTLKEQSIRDGLTGLFNHRYFWHILRHDFSLAHRHHHELSCLLVDLDFFKKVNDLHGHLFGDKVLKGVARQISKHVRQTDTVSRYGGEEFSIILPNTSLDGALFIAENIRKLVERCRFSKGGEIIRVTASIGVASLSDHRPDTPERLLDFADTALYGSKHAGRNRVISYSTTIQSENLLDAMGRSSFCIN
jgi:diguanylate cyclase (GGDEF)-like protein